MRSAALMIVAKILLFPVVVAAWALLWAAAGLGLFASLLQWTAATLANDAVSAMTVGDPGAAPAYAAAAVLIAFRLRHSFL